MDQTSHLGDLIRAWKELGVPEEDAALRQEIASMLHLERRAEAAPVAKERVVEEPAVAQQVPAKPPTPQQVGERVEFYVVPLTEGVSTEMPGVLAVPSLPRGSELPAGPTKPGLLNPRWERSLLSALISQTETTMEIELEPLLRDLCSLRPVTSIPRRTAPTVRHGAQIWLDRTAVMAPLLDDQSQFVRAIRRVAGEERVAVRDFTTVPIVTAGSAPFLIVSDFGLLPVQGRGGSTTLGQWERIAEAAREAGVPRVIGITPTPKKFCAGSAGAQHGPVVLGCELQCALHSSHLVASRVTQDQRKIERNIEVSKWMDDAATAADLAAMLSIASVAEPSLLRRARLELNGLGIEADVSTEIALWFKSGCGAAKSYGTSLRTGGFESFARKADEVGICTAGARDHIRRGETGGAASGDAIGGGS